MTVLRHAAMAGVLACAPAAFVSACGTDAVGVDGCRDIEQARCAAAGPCIVDLDVDECRRFYRDHCLHGMPLEDSVDKNRVRACVTQIEAAGSCAKDGVEDPALCERLTVASGVETVCDAILTPEKMTSCGFLAPVEPPPSPPPDASDGGQTGTPDAPSEAPQD